MNPSTDTTARWIAAASLLSALVLLHHHAALPDASAKPAPQRVSAARIIDAAAHTAAAATIGQRKHASFGRVRASHDAHEVADWVISANDSRGLPFVIIDKRNAKLFVFDGNGRLQGAAPVLLGLALGDDTAPGIGDRKLADIRPDERTTPAGRFVAEMGRNARGEDVVWVDYDAAVSMHRVLTTNPAERRLQRLATPSVADNRISYGCINVPVRFFNTQISPLFAKTNAVVYVLPETRSTREVFGAQVSADDAPPALAKHSGHTRVALATPPAEH